MTKIILETQRLYLRELEPGDVAEACRLLQDDETMYAYEGALSDAGVQAWIDRQIARYTDDGFGLWAVILKETSDMIGQIGLTMQQVGDRRVPEVGYLLRKEYWHQGYAGEAAAACRDYAIGRLGFEAVYSIIRDTNLASQRVAERMGMRRAGTTVKHYRGVDMLHYIYVIGRAEA